MRVLLDTHALLWFLAGDSRLSSYGRTVISDPDNVIQISVGSLWEITIKTSLGKLTLSESFEDFISYRLAAEQIEVLPIERQDLAILRWLPFHHGDPFDRLIIAQAMAKDIPVITRDTVFSRYEIEVLWNEP